MLARALRAGLRLFLGALVVWAARLLFHSKLPEPEGEWRELTREDLTGS